MTFSESFFPMSTIDEMVLKKSEEAKATFSEQFESYSGSDLQKILSEISSGREDPTLNVGGPSIVALIHAAQLLQGTGTEIRFFGNRGNDAAGEFLRTK